MRQVAYLKSRFKKSALSRNERCWHLIDSHASVPLSELMSHEMTSPRSQHTAQGRMQDDQTAPPCDGGKYCLRLEKTANLDARNRALNEVQRLHRHNRL